MHTIFAVDVYCVHVCSTSSVVLCLGLQEVSSALDVVNMFEGSLSFADNLTMIVNQVNARTHTHAYKALYNVCMYVTGEVRPCMLLLFN